MGLLLVCVLPNATDCLDACFVAVLVPEVLSFFEIVLCCWSGRLLKVGFGVLWRAVRPPFESRTAFDLVVAKKLAFSPLLVIAPFWFKVAARPEAKNPESAGALFCMPLEVTLPGALLSTEFLRVEFRTFVLSHECLDLAVFCWLSLREVAL